MVSQASRTEVGPTPAYAPGRGYAIYGIVAGITALVGGFSGFALDVSDGETPLEAAEVIALSAGNDVDIAVLAASFVISALAVVVFGAGLRRRLVAAAPHGLSPDLALAGTVLVAASALIGSGPATDVGANLRLNLADPDVLVANASSLVTITWVWGALALTSTAVAVASLGKARALPRWLGVFSVVLTVLIAAAAILPAQYLAMPLAALWLIVAGLGILLSRNRPPVARS